MKNFTFFLILLFYKLFNMVIANSKFKSRLSKKKIEVLGIDNRLINSRIGSDNTKNREVIPANIIPQQDGIKKNIIIERSGNSMIKQETIEYTLNNMNISNNLNDYKTHFYRGYKFDKNNMINIAEISNNCSNIECELCKKSTPFQCIKCVRGYFLFNNICYTVCPDNSIADIFMKRCVPLDHKNSLEQITYHKSFTVGSCKNMCGKILVDCSCESSCIKEGNCCSDYHICEDLINKNNFRRAECNRQCDNCELCESFDTSSSKAKCGKCMDNYFNREGVCISMCNSSDILHQSNKICEPPGQVCLVQDCALCDSTNSSICNKCAKGYFMYNNQCLLVCPLRLRADRISWTCLEPPVFAWYWIFPSKKSCRNNCGKSFLPTNGCSCRDNCFRYGNCCEDIEDFCQEYIYWK